MNPVIIGNATLNRTIFGDCRTTLRQLSADGVRVQTCVTSPPYYGLRDYGHPGQLGLEEKPDEYIANMIEVFRAVRDVLADDGTLWLNLGDSYARTGGTDRKVSSTAQVGSTRSTLEQMSDRTSNAAALALKPKDLIGIPWMLAFALRADGWYLRQDIIWHKTNPKPESVRDRCTKAHEYLFLLSKSERYFFDSDAMREPAIGGKPGNTKPTKAARSYVDGVSKHRTSANLHKVGVRETRNRRSVWTIPTQPYAGAHFAVFPPALLHSGRITTR